MPGLQKGASPGWLPIPAPAGAAKLAGGVILAYSALKLAAHWRRMVADLRRENEALQRRLSSPRDPPGGAAPAPRRGAEGEGGRQEAPSPRVAGEENSTPEFLNEMLQEMWPHISAYAGSILQNTVQPLVQSALPAALGAQFQERTSKTLGTTPIVFTSMSVSKAFQEVATGRIEVLVLRSEFTWDADDMDIYLKLAAGGLGIKRLLVKGVLYIEFVGMIDVPPMFEGLRVFFINPPEIDLEFQGITTLLNMGILKRKIIGVITNGISGALTLPHRKGAMLSADADIFRVLQPRPEGILTVKVHKAEKLIAKDTNVFQTLFSAATSDPYVVVKFGSQVYKSATVPKNINPSFDYDVSLVIDEKLLQTVDFELYDENVVQAEDLLGKLSISTAELSCLGSEAQTFDLKDEEGATGKNGQLTLSAQWQPLLLKETEGCEGVGLIFVGVYFLQNVPCMPKGTDYRAVVTCSGKVPSCIKNASSQETSRIVPAESEIPAANSAHLEQTKAKVSICKKYKMSQDEMGKLLGIDADLLDKSLEDVDQLDRMSQVHEKIDFSESFQFLVEDMRKQTLSVKFMANVKTLRGTSELALGDRCLGEYTTTVEDICADASNTLQITQGLPNTSIAFKLRIQARFLAKAQHC